MLRSIIHAEIINRSDAQSSFFSHLAFQSTLERFVPFDFASRQRP
jgi:hypothetical protein